MTENFEEFADRFLKEVVYSRPCPILVHYSGRCRDCDAIFEGTLDDYNKVRRQAKRHAEKMGHEVNMETGYSTIFGGERQ